jgi:hypothetical protein
LYGQAAADFSNIQSLFPKYEFSQFQGMGKLFLMGMGETAPFLIFTETA